MAMVQEFQQGYGRNMRRVIAFLLLAGIMGCQDAPPPPPQAKAPVVKRRIILPEASPEKTGAGVAEKKAAGSKPETVRQAETSAVPEKGSTPEGDAATMVAPYDGTSRVDPFLPLIAKKAEIRDKNARKLERRAPKTPLEKVDLSQLRLVGIIGTPAGRTAMVEESSGKGYVVQKGTYMGLHSGKVTAVDTDRIVVTEIIEDLSGELREQSRELKLQKPTGD